MNKKINTKKITRSGLIAGIYVILMLVQSIPAASLTFGAVQLRLAEGLTLLPLVDPAAIPGVFIGCLISNLMMTPMSGFGLVDIIGGSLVTLVAAILTSKMKNKWTGMLPPILLNGFIVSIWVSYFTGIPYLATVAGIGIGEAISVGLFGSIILYAYERAVLDKNRL